MQASLELGDKRQQDPKWRLLTADEMILGELLDQAQLPLLEIPGISEERLNGLLMEGQCTALELDLLMWQKQGEQIFDLSPISAMFQGSDATSLPVAFLKLPYRTFYLHWGKHLEIPSPWPGRFIEGCYVDSGKVTSGSAELSMGLSFLFVCSDTPKYHWDEHTLEANIITDVEGTLHLFAATDEDGTVGSLVRQFTSEGYTEETQSARWAEYLPAALSIAANCLCFLSSPKGDIKDQFPSEAPPRLTRQLTSQRPTEVRRAKSKLGALGFRVIHLCGQQLASRIGIVPGSRVMPTHWRKGHWRPTRYGKGKTLVKVDWIDATVVNADQGKPTGGHLYVP